MPTAQLFGAGLEQAVNRLLALDPDTPQALRPLQGKRLSLDVRELPWRITLAFSDRVDVQMGNDDSDADASVTLSLAIAPTLRDNRQLTQLIKAGELSVEGDLQVVQQVSQLARELDIDWEEVVARHTGDVVAHTVFRQARQVGQRIQEGVQRWQRTISNAALEEKPVAAHPLAVAHFSDQVDCLRSDSERLAARLAQLENQLNDKA
ncbi:SCP2 sterol-binding domain-containing protein [Aestuariibacter halophilus]|uniref:Ubiquinone biosynthesis accessory factor UbiJ n=1 Tax=Fluctibacter halophilus TaxID=226011 RepID=A0ABS8G9F1_9ALTE|nr:SCP2 sterol-binding domain-containing protein [Aestuariibacter halophilus]MCC2617197.1 SCP2 sterol-binding domain-containing protein [Aestuariibacter halophilus]